MANQTEIPTLSAIAGQTEILLSATELTDQTEIPTGQTEILLSATELTDQKEIPTFYAIAGQTEIVLSATEVTDQTEFPTLSAIADRTWILSPATDQTQIPTLPAIAIADRTEIPTSAIEVTDGHLRSSCLAEQTSRAAIEIRQIQTSVIEANALSRNQNQDCLWYQF